MEPGRPVTLRPEAVADRGGVYLNGVSIVDDLAPALSPQLGRWWAHGAAQTTERSA